MWRPPLLTSCLLPSSLQVWRSRVSSKHNRDSLLVVDVHRGHLSDTFKDRLSAADTDLAFIPPGCSCRLQPLEICVMQVLRDFLQVPTLLLGLDTCLIWCGVLTVTVPSGPVDPAGF